MDVLFVVTAGAFALLCSLAVGRGLKHRHASSFWLAVGFAAIAVAGALSPQLDESSSPEAQFAGLVAVVVAMLLHPVALVEFVHGLDPVPLRRRVALRTAATVLLVATVVQGSADPAAFADVEPLSVTSMLLWASVSIVWLATTAVVGTRLLRLSRSLTSSVGRARARMMAAGVLVLVPAVGIPFVLPMFGESSGAFFAVCACALTWLGYAPSRGLRAAWARTDTRRLTDVEVATMRDPSSPLQPWLDTVRAVWNAEAAWIEADGRVVVGSGRAVPRHPAPGVAASDDRVQVERVAPTTWLLSATTPEGTALRVRTHRDPVLFGDDDSDLLVATAGRLQSTIARRELEQREREEQARRQSALHMAETVQLREDVLSTLSHELRTPLVTLRGVPELLLRRWSAIDGTQLTEMLQRMHDNALTLHRLVESTLLLASVRAGEQRIHVEATTAGTVIGAALERLDRVGVEVGRVRVLGDEGLAVDTDVRHAAAVLAELVHNALTYSDAPAPVDVELRADGPDVEVRVVDRGRGVSNADRDRMLQAFGRAGDVLHRDRRGLGVGLTLVHELVARLQAQLDVHATVGGGTAVSVRLPAVAASSGATVVPLTRSGIAG